VLELELGRPLKSVSIKKNVSLTEKNPRCLPEISPLYEYQSMTNLQNLIVGRQLISPLDLETVYSLTESEIFP